MTRCIAVIIVVFLVLPGCGQTDSELPDSFVALCELQLQKAEEQADLMASFKSLEDVSANEDKLTSITVEMFQISSRMSKPTAEEEKEVERRFKDRWEAAKARMGKIVAAMSPAVRERCMRLEQDAIKAHRQRRGVSEDPGKEMKVTDVPEPEQPVPPSDQAETEGPEGEAVEPPALPPRQPRTFGQSFAVILGASGGAYRTKGYVNYVEGKPGLFQPGAVIVVGIRKGLDLGGKHFDHGAVVVVEEGSEGPVFRLATTDDKIVASRAVEMLGTEYPAGPFRVPQGGKIMPVEDEGGE